MRIVFVCTGNICRSPTAEAVVRAKIADTGLLAVDLDSVGTAGHHVGDPPDRRAQTSARRRGYNLSELRARQLDRRDFEAADLLLAMDRGHMRRMQSLCPRHRAGALRMFMDFATIPADEVPDPYYGDSRGFDTMMDLIEAGAEGLVAALQRGDLR